MRLGIIAGGGALPQLLAEHCRKQEIEHCVFYIDQPGINVEGQSSTYTFRLGAVGKLAALLSQQKITDVVFIGSVNKPTLWALRPDLFTLRQLPGLGLFTKGDDSLLRRIVKRFETHLHVSVRGIHELMPGLLSPLGVMTKRQPDVQQGIAIKIGADAARQHGLNDKGQAVLADNTYVIDTEQRDGTSALLKRMTEPHVNAVLVKLVKPQQDLRLDMPTIGPETIKLAAAAGLCGIAVSAGKTLIVDQAATISLADAAQLFLVGIE